MIHYIAAPILSAEKHSLYCSGAYGGVGHSGVWSRLSLSFPDSNSCQWYMYIENLYIVSENSTGGTNLSDMWCKNYATININIPTYVGIFIFMVV